MILLSNIRINVMRDTCILIITTPEDQYQFQKFLGDGKQWGINLEFLTQEKPDGIAQAFTIISEDFLAGSPSALILGDNIFWYNLSLILASAAKKQSV